VAGAAERALHGSPHCGIVLDDEDVHEPKCMGVRVRTE
jgi:hypothetical protein